MNGTFSIGSLQLCHISDHQFEHPTLETVLMKNLLVITGLLTAMAPLFAESSNAGSRNFFTPTVGGDRLSFCVNTGDACGKPIADAWCRAVGFDKALNYRRDASRTSQSIVARYADTGGVCTGTECESFRQIKCWRA